MSQAHTFPPENDNRLPSELKLQLLVEDSATIGSLCRYPEGPERTTRALTALRLGSLALEHVRGQVDAEAVRHEADRLMGTLSEALTAHADGVQSRVSTTLGSYFDPESGRLEERLRRLVDNDGELDRVLQKALGDDHSQLANTLTAYIGEKSRLMQLLDPESAQSVVATLKGTIEKQLVAQDAAFKNELSLDNEQGALRRMLGELEQRHGQLDEAFEKRVDSMVSELSLDREDSALSRLVQRVERAQRTIREELTLDSEASSLSRLDKKLDSTQRAVAKQLTLDDKESPLSRMRLELVTLIEKLTTAQAEFQKEVGTAVARLDARREEAERGTHHGLEFEELVNVELERRAQAAGDLFERTGNRSGKVSRKKVGDAVIELGSDSAAPGARLVIEAKQDQSFTVPRAFKELEDARLNRDADVGLFIVSKRCAPEGQQALQRQDSDVLVVWDAENPDAGVVLDAAFLLTRALAVRAGQQQESDGELLSQLEKAIIDIEKRVENLDVIETSAQSIERSSQKILKRVQLDRAKLDSAVESLQEVLAGLREEDE